MSYTQRRSEGTLTDGFEDWVRSDLSGDTSMKVEGPVRESEGNHWWSDDVRKQMRTVTSWGDRWRCARTYEFGTYT
jgi:hypothetical protein